MTQKTLNFLENYRSALEICRTRHEKQEPVEYTFLPADGRNPRPSLGTGRTEAGAYEKTMAV